MGTHWVCGASGPPPGLAWYSSTTKVGPMTKDCARLGRLVGVAGVWVQGEAPADGDGPGEVAVADSWELELAAWSLGPASGRGPGPASSACPLDTCLPEGVGG